jgi:hypothetical protein
MDPTLMWIFVVIFTFWFLECCYKAVRIYWRGLERRRQKDAELQKRSQGLKRLRDEVYKYDDDQ